MVDDTNEQQVDAHPEAAQAANPEAAQAAAQQLASQFDQNMIGQRLAGRYLIQQPLGAGGMSIVYKGLHESIERTVAIKTLKLDLCSVPVIVSRFEREIKSLSKLNHPNIVTVYDCVVTAQGQPYIVMDFIEGESLQDALEREHQIEPGRAVKIFMQVCQALEHAHRQGVVHRDLKPGNIMLGKGNDGNDIVKVVDFGLAKLVEDTQKLTHAGQIWGSAPYLSPEQCQADESVPIDHRTDVYSLGAVLYETLTGKDPYFGCDLLETIRRHLQEPPPPFKDANPNVTVPPALESVVFNALQKSPENRFQTMQEFREALSFAASPLLKKEQEVTARVLQEKIDERQKRAAKEEKARRSALRKVQRKSNPFNIFAVVVFTAGVTLFLSIWLVLPMLTHFQTSHGNTNISIPPTAAIHLHNSADVSVETVGQQAATAVDKNPVPPPAKHIARHPVIAKHPFVPEPKKVIRHPVRTEVTKPAPSANPWSNLERLKTK